jgi:hypothetical protein
MAHFISFIRGNRGEASRLGSKDSGIKASAQGWDCGISVNGRCDRNDHNRFAAFATTGSNGGGSSTWLGSCGKDSDGYKISVNPELPKVVPNKDYMELVDKLVGIMKKEMPPEEIAVAILIELNYIQEGGGDDD